MSEEQATQPENAGCPECGSADDWGGASWCPNCGFYPALNQQVGAPPPVEEEVEYERWWELIPSWVWVLGAGIAALFALSVAIRVMFAESPIRFWWTIGQMVVGLIALGVAHLMAYFHGVGKTDKLGPLDMFLKPIATWQSVLRDLPDSSNLVCTFGCSIAALLLGYFVVDGVDYADIMQQAFEEQGQSQEEQAAEDGKNKQSPMSKVLQTAKTASKVKEAMSPKSDGASPASVEDAVAEMTGGDSLTTGASDGPGGSESSGGSIDGPQTDAPRGTQQPSADGQSDSDSPTSPVSTPASPEENMSPSEDSSLTEAEDPESVESEVECLVLGYTTNASGEIRSLLLAAAPDRELLRFVAKIPVEAVDADVLSRMSARFPKIPERQSIIRCPYGGNWIKPVIFCVTTYDGWTADRRLSQPQVIRLINAD